MFQTHVSIPSGQKIKKVAEKRHNFFIFSGPSEPNVSNRFVIRVNDDISVLPSSTPEKYGGRDGEKL